MMYSLQFSINSELQREKLKYIEKEMGHVTFTITKCIDGQITHQIKQWKFFPEEACIVQNHNSNAYPKTIKLNRET